MKTEFLSVWSIGLVGRCLLRRSFWRLAVSFGAAAILFVCGGGQSAPAAETNEVQALRQQLQQLQENLERVQREQKQQIDELTRKLDELTKQSSVETEKKKLERELAAEMTTNTPAGPASAPATQPTPTPAWPPAQPLTIARAGGAYVNLSFDALVDVGWSTASDPAARLQLGDHDPINRGFSLRNAELVLDGAVDPYFKGFANIVFKLDQHNETSVELEETYLQTSDLPLNLQARAGQFFANFGRQNPQHPHQWAFVDQPIILNRAFGPDGLRNIGAQVSWLAPLPFYTEASLGIYKGEGSTAFSFRNDGEPDLLGVNRMHEHNTFSRLLVGELLVGPPAEIVKTLVLFVVVGAAHFAFRKKFLGISADADAVAAAGVNVRWWDLLFYMLFGLVVTSFVHIGGVLLVFSYLVVPAVCATYLAESIRARFFVGWWIATACSVGSLLLSARKNLPIGATTVCVLGGFLIILLVIKRFLPQPARQPTPPAAPA